MPWPRFAKPQPQLKKKPPHLGSRAAVSGASDGRDRVRTVGTEADADVGDRASQTGLFSAQAVRILLVPSRQVEASHQHNDKSGGTCCILGQGAPASKNDIFDILHGTAPFLCCAFVLMSFTDCKELFANICEQIRI